MIRPLILPTVLFFISCSSRPNHSPTNDTIQVSNLNLLDTVVHPDSVLVKNFTSDTLIVDQPCAVFYIADSAQAAKREKKAGIDTGYGGVDGVGDDNAYYLDQASAFLEKQKVKILNVDD